MDMNNVGIPDYKLADVDSTNIMTHNTNSHLEHNGFLLCKSGSISLLMDEHIYNVCARDMYIYPAFTYTRIVEVSSDFKGVLGTVDFDFALSSIGSISNTHSHVFIRFHPHIPLTDGQYRRIEKIIACLRDRTSMQTRLNQQVVSSIIQALCYDIIDIFMENTSVETDKQTRKDRVFQSFLISLYSNFRIHRDVTFYAQQQNLTPRYFATLIHRVSGKTPLQWISMFVITEAKRLLSNPDASIKDVAYKLNFTERSSFGHYYRQYASCSPSEYKDNAIRETWHK